MIETSTRPEPLLTAQELADFLGVPIHTLYFWNKHKDGPPSLRVGKHLRYRRDDVELWLKTREQT